MRRIRSVTRQSIQLYRQSSAHQPSAV